MQESSVNINRRRFEDMSIDEFIEALSKIPSAREEVVSPEYSSAAGATPQSNFRTQENVEKPQRKAPVTIVSMFVGVDNPNLYRQSGPKESNKFRKSLKKTSHDKDGYGRFQ